MIVTDIRDSLTTTIDSDRRPDVDQIPKAAVGDDASSGTSLPRSDFRFKAMSSRGHALLDSRADSVRRASRIDDR